MTDASPPAADILVNTGGLVVTDDGRKVVLLDRGTGLLSNLIVVLALATLAAIAVGVWNLVNYNPAPGWGLIAAGVVLALITNKVVLTYRTRRKAPLPERRTVAVLDRKLNLFSYSGGAITALDQVSFIRRPQLNSTAAKLVALTPGGKKVLMRGYRLDGGIGRTDELLNTIAQGR